MLSVIIPTCNRNDLLSNCLKKLHPDVQKMDSKSYEVIVTDDSKNNIAKKLIDDKYKWVNWRKGPGKGPAANRNNGARYAKGEWLVFFDDDCEPEQGVLQSYLLESKNEEQIDVIEGLIYSDLLIKPLFIAPINLKGGFLWSCNFAIKKVVFNSIDGFDENFKYPNLEDVDLHRRLQMKRYRISFNNRARVYHPPRPIASPAKMALYHENWFYYHLKFGEPKTLLQLLRLIVRNRMVSIIRSPKNLKTFAAIFLCLKEIFFTIIYSTRWKIKVF